MRERRLVHTSFGVYVRCVDCKCPTTLASMSARIRDAGNSPDRRVPITLSVANCTWHECACHYPLPQTITLQMDTKEIPREQE